MRVLTAIGEIGITVNSRDFLFRPSLYAMSTLADPIDLYGRIHNPNTSKAIEQDRFLAAIEVLCACTDDDIGDLIGYTGSRHDRWVAGKLPFTNIVILASSLIRHGVTGVVPEVKAKTDSEYTDKFEPRSLVSIAIAHLGMSETEAWNMTVTGFVLAMRAKYPDPSIEKDKKEKDLLKKYDKMMARNGRIQAAKNAARSM